MYIYTHTHAYTCVGIYVEHLTGRTMMVRLIVIIILIIRTVMTINLLASLIIQFIRAH